MRKIIFCFNTSWFAHNHRLALMLACKEEGWEVHILCPDGVEVAELEKYGFHVHLQYISRKGVNPIVELKTLVQIFFKIRKLKPDIYHGFTIKPVVYGALCCRLNRVKKAIFTITGMGSAFMGKGFRSLILKQVLNLLYRSVFNKDKHIIIFQNPTDKMEFDRNHWAPGLQTHLIPGTGVNTSRFKPTQEKYLKTRLVFAGSLIRDKGLDELLAACHQVYQAGQEFELLVLGSPDPENPSGYSVEDWNRLSQQPYIKWLGPQIDVAPLIRQSHIACLPSYREGCPLFLLEAGACALPSVATDVPGCNYLITDNKNGLLVPARDSGALAVAILKLLKDGLLRERLGAEAYSRVSRAFTQEKVIGLYLDIYRGQFPMHVAA